MLLCSDEEGAFRRQGALQPLPAQLRRGQCGTTMVHHGADRTLSNNR